MNFIKKIFRRKKSTTKLGGYDLDDKGHAVYVESSGPEELVEPESEIVKIEKIEKPAEVKKKPGRPKGSTAKKAPAKKTAAKKTPAKKTPSKKTPSKKKS